jgi:CBS-domain-containing membrane protein
MADTDPAGTQCPIISDGDIYEAMKEIPGYLDITPADLKEIYRHALRHALERVARPVKASEIMTRSVHHVRVDTPLLDVAELMARHGISGVPVLDAADRVAGVISEKDFLRRLDAGGTGQVMGVVAAGLAGRGWAAGPIGAGKASDIMAAPAVTVREGTSSLEIMAILAEKNINRVPVVDAAGRLAGIVSRADILRAQSAPPE